MDQEIETGIGSTLPSSLSIELEDREGTLDRVGDTLGSIYKYSPGNLFIEGSKTIGNYFKSFGKKEIENNKKFLAEVDKLKSEDKLTTENLHELQKEFKKDSTVLGSVTTNITTWDKSEDKFNKISPKETKEFYKEKGINISDHTSNDWYNIGDDQVQSDINGAISSEYQYLNTLADKSGLTVSEIKEYGTIKEVLDNNEFSKIIPDYNDLVSKYGKEKVDAFYGTEFKNKINSVEKKLDSTDRFTVDLPGIGGGVFLDSTDTSLSPRELYSYYKNLVDANNEAIKKTTGLNREEFEKVKRKEELDKIAYSLDDSTIEAIKETKEFKAKIETYKDFGQEDLAIKEEKLAQDQLDLMHMNEKIESVDNHFVKKLLKQEKDRLISYQELLSGLDDKVVRKTNEYINKGQYKKLTNKELKNKVLEQIIDNLSVEERQKYETALKERDSINSITSMDQGIGNMMEGGFGERIWGLRQWGSGLFQGASAGFGDAFQGSINVVTSPIDSIKGTENFKDDMYEYTKGIRNDQSGLFGTLADLRYSTDDFGSFIFSFLGNPETAVASGITEGIGVSTKLVSLGKKIKKIDNVINKIIKEDKGINKIISAYKKGVELSKEEQIILESNPKLFTLLKNRASLIMDKTKEVNVIKSLNAEKLKAFKKGEEKINLKDKIKWFIDTNEYANKATRLGAFGVDSAIVNMKIDAGMDQAFGGITGDDLLQQNMLFNILGDSIMGSVVLGFGKKHFTHGTNLSDVAKLFDSRKDLNEGIDIIRRRVAQMNGGIVISKNDALEMIQSSMKTLSAYSKKNARQLNSIEDIQQYIKDILDKKITKANTITDDGRIISFYDNLSKFNSQETRMEEFTKLYNNAKSRKNGEKAAKFYKAKIEEELKLIETLNIYNDSKAFVKATGGKFEQTKSAYLGSNLKIDNKAIRAEKMKEISVNVNKVRKHLNEGKKIDTSKLMNDLKDTITKYDEAGRGGRLMTVYDPYTQKSFTIDTKAFKIQASALATEKGISTDEAEKIILSTGGMKLNVGYKYADVEINDKAKRIFGFSDNDIKKRVTQLGGDLKDIEIQKVDGIKKIHKFIDNNKISKEINKAYGNVIHISDNVATGYNVSFSKPMFGKKDIDKYMESFVKDSGDLNISKNVIELNEKIAKIIPGIELNESSFNKHIQINLHKILQTNSHLGTINLKEILKNNENFIKLSLEDKEKMVLEISDIYLEHEMKFYKSVMETELGEGIFSKKNLKLGKGFKSGQNIIDLAGKQDGILTFVDGILFKEDSRFWNNIIYIMPGTKSKGSKAYKKAYAEVLERTSKGKKGAAALQPMRSFTQSQIETIYKMKAISGDKGVGLYMGIIKDDEIFNAGDYINEVYKTIYAKEGKNNAEELNKEVKNLRLFIKDLQTNILDSSDEYLDNVIIKNVIHNYVLQKDLVMQTLKEYEHNDANFRLLQKIFMSDISMQGVLNYKTANGISEKTGKKIELFLENKRNEEKKIFNNKYEAGQREIDNLRSVIDHTDSTSATIELNNRLKKLIDKQNKFIFISKENYIQNNLGLGLYQDIFNRIKTKQLEYVNNITKPNLKNIKIDLNKFKISEKKRIQKEIINFAEKDGTKSLDIEHELKILDNKRAKISESKEQLITDLDELKKGLGSDISKKDKELAMAEFITKKEQDIAELKQFLNEIDSFEKLNKPVKPKSIKGKVLSKPSDIKKGYSDKAISLLKKDTRDAINNIGEQIKELEHLEDLISIDKTKKILDNIGEKINKLEIKSQVFDDIFNDINNLEDITKFKIDSIDGSELKYNLGGASKIVNIENLSEGQIDTLNNILLFLQKDREGITSLDLSIDEVRHAKNQIHTEKEIGDVIYKDITNSLMLDYEQKAEHLIIKNNFKNKFNNIEDLNKKVDSFIVSDLSNIENINKEFKSFVGDLLDGTSYTYRTEDGILKTIKGDDILKQLDIHKLKNRFISERNKDLEEVVSMGTEITPKGFPIYKTEKVTGITPSIFYKHLKSKLDNIRYLDGQSEKQINLLAKTVDVFTYKTNDELDKLDILGLINGTNVNRSFTINKITKDGASISQELRGTLGLKDGEILALGFGDKDGFSMIYKNTDLKNFKIDDQYKITELAYFYDMAINGGFITTTRDEADKLWKGFIKEINKKKNYSFDEFREALFLYEKDGIRLSEITSGAKKYTKDELISIAGEDNELIQGFRMFKTSSDNIRKRLGSSSSKNYLFQNYKGIKAKYSGDLDMYLKSKGHKTLILRSLTDTELEGLLKGVTDIKTKINIFKDYAKDKYNIEGIINKRFDTNTDKQIRNRIKKIFLEDNTDGTGYITRDIGKINKDMNGGSETIIKSHIQGINDAGQINLGKGQLNAKDISVIDKGGNVIIKSEDLTETLFMGEGMHKIKGGATDLKGTGRFVVMDETIDGVTKKVKMEIIGIDDNIDYSFYKEAASTKAVSKEDVSINNMISGFDLEYGEELNAKIIKKIDKIIKDFEKKYNIDLGMQGKFGDLNVVMGKLLASKEELRFSDQYYNNKFDGLINELKGTIDEVRTGGSGLKALRVDSSIHPDDIVIHPNSDLAKQLAKDFKEGETQYVVTTRYPISDKYVTGLYRVKYSTDIDKKHIITNPENAFYKLRADFDGDTITTYSAKDEYASIAARAIYDIAGHGDAKKLNIEEVLKNIEEKFKDKNFRLNTYIEAAEVGDKKLLIHNYRSFPVNTFIAQKAYNSISIGAATIRTGDIMNNAIKKVLRSKDINGALNDLNKFQQVSILRGVLGKDLIKIKFKNLSNDEQGKYIAKIVRDFLERDDVVGFNKSLGIKNYFEHYDLVFKNIIENVDEKTKAKINKYVFETFDTNIKKDFGITQEDIITLSQIKQDREYATIGGEVLNDFLDFGKSGKESIPADFDKKLLEKIYGKDINYERLKADLSLLSMNNKIKWKKGIKITQHDFKNYINNNVSGNSLGLWNHAYDKIEKFIEIQKASNELPFLLKRFDTLLDEDSSKELHKIFDIKTKGKDIKTKAGVITLKSELDMSNSINKLLYNLTDDILGSTTYIQKSSNKQYDKLDEFKKLLFKHTPDNLKEKLFKLSGNEKAFFGLKENDIGYKVAYENLKKSNQDVFNEFQKIKNNGEIKDTLVIALLSKTFTKERQAMFKEFNINNISLQNILSDKLTVDYFKYSTLNKQKIIKNKFKNFNLDTKNAYLNQIKEIKDGINKKILSMQDKYILIDEKYGSELKKIQELYKIEKEALNNTYDKLLEDAKKLDTLNKKKITYRTKKAQYDKDILEYNLNVDQLEKDNKRVTKELKDYTNLLKEYNSTIDNEKIFREKAGLILGEDVSKLSNDEIKAGLNSKIKAIKKDIPEDINMFELQLDQKNIKLNDDGKKYIVGNEEYDRVSDYTTSPFEVKPGYEDLAEYSSNIGKEAESVIRKVLDGEVPKLGDYNVLKNLKKGEFENFIEQAKLLKDRLKGEKIYAYNLKLKDDSLKLAGEINLITKKDGKYKLYDIKTIRDNLYYNKKLEKLDDNIGNKLSMYSYIFNKNYTIKGEKIVIDEINVIPFRVKYDYSDVLDPETNKLLTLRDIHHIQLDDTLSLTMKESLEEINADLMIKKIQTSDTIRDPFVSYKKEIEKLDKYLDIIDTKKKSLEIPKPIDKPIETIEELNDMQIKINTIEKDIINQEAILTDVEELNKMKQSKIKEFKEINKGTEIDRFEEDELTIEGLYTGWDKRMSIEVANSMKGILDSFKGQWHFQFIDELKDKDPEFLDRINLISHHLGADFKKLNDETIEWNKIMISIKKSLKGEVSNELVLGLTKEEAKTLDKEYEGFWKRMRSTNIFFAGDESYKIGDAFKTALGKSLKGEGGDILIDNELFEKYFKELVLDLKTKPVVMTDDIKDVVKKYFPDLHVNELTEGHINYILLRQNKELYFNIDKYIKGTAEYALDKVNTLDEVVGESLDVLGEYSKKGVQSHLIDDIIEAQKGDNNFAVISMGLQDKQDFMNRLVSKGFSEKNANILFNKLYKKERVSGQKIWDFLNFITYEIKYGVGNLVHGAGTVAATVQMPGQFTEAMSRNRMYNISNADVKRMVQEFGFGLDENTHVFASGIGLQAVDNPFKNLGTDTISNIGYQLDKYINHKIGIDPNLGGFVRSTMDYAINPLGKQDAPFDLIKRETAIKQAMHESGYHNYEDFIIALDKYGEGEKIRLQTKIRMIYNELGGGVGSKDSLYKINKMFNTSGFAEIDNRSKLASFVMRSWDSLGGYLVHWMANKTMRQYEVLRNLVVATKKGDIKALKELGKVAIARATNIAYLTTMGLKYDKYQGINTKRKDGQYKLVETLVNDVVALNAFTSFVVDRYERNKLMDLGLGEEVLTYLQAFTKRFTGPLNTIPNLIDSLYDKISNKEFKNMSEAQFFGTVLSMMKSTVRDNGGAMNRYAGMTSSDYGELNVGTYFSTMTGLGIGGREGEINKKIWRGYGASEDFKLLRDNGLLGYAEFIARGLIGSHIFNSTSTETNRIAQSLKTSIRSNVVLDSLDKAFYDGEGNINSIMELLRGEKFSKKGDLITKIYKGKKETVNINDIIVIKSIQKYYRENGYEAIYNLNKDGIDVKSSSPEEQFRNNLMREKFGDLSKKYEAYINEGGTHNYETYVNDYIAGYITKGDGKIIINKEQFAVPEIMSYIINKEFSKKKTEFLKDKFGNNYYRIGKGYKDILEYESQKLYLEVISNMGGLLQHDRGLKRELEQTALYLDDELQQSLKKETGYYLPLGSYNDKTVFNKYPQSDSDHKKGAKVMSRLQGFNQADDFAHMLRGEGKSGIINAAIKVLGYTATDPGIVEKTLDSVKKITTQDEFNDIVLTLLDTANTTLLKKGAGRKLGEIFEKTGAKQRMVDYMYVLSEQAKDYDPTKDEETKGYTKAYNGFNKFKKNKNDYGYNGNSNYGSFKNQDGLYDAYKPVRDFVNANRGLLSNNPYKAVEERLYTGKAQPSRLSKLFEKYYIPRLQEVQLDNYHKGPIVETGTKYANNVTYKKIDKMKKIRVRQSKVKSKKKYARKSMNLLSGMTFGKIN